MTGNSITFIAYHLREERWIKNMLPPTKKQHYFNAVSKHTRNIYTPYVDMRGIYVLTTRQTGREKT